MTVMHIKANTKNSKMDNNFHSKHRNIFRNIAYTILTISLISCVQKNIDISSNEWIQDLNYFSKKLPKVHNNLYFKLSEKDFNQKINLLISQVDSLSHNEILFNLMHILSSIGDAHTKIGYYEWNFNCIPIYTYVCDDGLLILGTFEGYQYLIGKKVLKINDTDIMDIQNILKSFIPHENKYWIKQKIPEYIINADLLKFTHIIDSPDSVTVTYLDNGITKHVKMKTTRSNHLSNIKMIYYSDYLNLELPIAWRIGNKNYWFQYFDKEQAIYFQYNQCVNMGNESFSHFSNKFFKFISKNPVHSIIVDVRFNSGGDSDLFSNHFSPKLKSFTRQSDADIYTIIGRKTFSSGLWVAIEMKNEYQSILVGEPSGNKPNHYGESRNFELPNSKLNCYYSIKYWKMLDSEKDALYPDVPIKIESKDILAGRDECLETVFKLINNPIHKIQKIN